jgi:uncharacterized protein YjbJ (UPF0337 family)
MLYASIHACWDDGGSGDIVDSDPSNRINRLEDEAQMNEMVMKGKWHQVKGALREQWGKLTDDDIKMFLGEGEQLVGRLQERYGYTQERAEQEVAKFMSSLSEDLPLSEVRDESAKVAREHPWFTGVFFGAIALLIAGYLLNRFVTVEEIREETMPQTA